MTAAVAPEVGARQYETVIGIETHCELGTATKMFCACPTVFGAEPNTQVCPVCLGEPGSLPVANGRAVEYAARIGLALHCRIAERSQFHRKNYFYPDMPKNYQISQYDEPLCVGGWLDVDVEGELRRVGITRVHLEEDTGKSLHVGATGRIHGADYSLVDYNRAGIPLVEIVSEPDLRSAEEARAYAEELRAVLLALGVSDAKLEEGSMRFDVNVSIRPVGHAELGTKVELKNLNSLRSLYRAVAYEADRQRRVLAEGGKLVQETRHWDEGAGRTEPMRSKEFATDYRYFPEPDLVPIEATAPGSTGSGPTCPSCRPSAGPGWPTATGLPAKEVGWLVRDPEVLAYFQEVASGRDPKVAASWVMGSSSATCASSTTPWPRTRWGRSGSVSCSICSPPAPSRPPRPRTCWPRCSPRRRRPRPSWSARAWPRSPTPASWRRWSSGWWPPTPTWPRSSAAASGACSAPWSARSCARPAAGPTPSWSATCWSAPSAADAARHTRTYKLLPT